AAHQHAGRTRAVHPGRDQEMGAGGEGRRHRAGIAVVPAQAGTYIPEPVVMGPRLRGDDILICVVPSKPSPSLQILRAAPRPDAVATGACSRSPSAPPASRSA